MLVALVGGVVSSTAFNPSPINQPLVVGPGFSLVPPKLVAQITAEKLIKLSNLLSVNLQQTEPEPQLLLDSHLVLTAQPKKQLQRIQEMVSWLDVFTIYMLVMVSRFSHRWRGLTQYKLLILQTYHHFSGQVWLDFDQAFREHATATNLTDWSNINAQLFSFHSASFPESTGSGDWKQGWTGGFHLLLGDLHLVEQGLVHSPIFTVSLRPTQSSLIRQSSLSVLPKSNYSPCWGCQTSSFAFCLTELLEYQISVQVMDTCTVGVFHGIDFAPSLPYEIWIVLGCLFTGSSCFS